MSDFRDMNAVLKEVIEEYPCTQADCIRTFSNERGRNQHLRMAHDSEVLQHPENRNRREYMRAYMKLESARRYSREYRRRKRQSDPAFREADREHARRRAETQPEALREYRKARAIALKTLVQRHKFEYKALLEDARSLVRGVWTP